MGKRHEAVGIKQVIRLEWLQKATNFLLAGINAKMVRQELHEFLANRKGNGLKGERGTTSRTQVVNMMMNIWVSPDSSLVSFRDASLTFLQKHPSKVLPVHWGMISAAYPFWFNVARQTGRLLALQDQVTHTQIISRLKEQYGDRQTISRYGRYVIRSFVTWGILQDSETKGCYERSAPIRITDPSLAALMLEAALHATPEGKGSLSLLMNNPGFFPFQLPVMTGDSIAQKNNRIEAARYSLDEELLKLKRRREQSCALS